MTNLKFGKFVLIATVGLAVVIAISFFVPELSLTRGQVHAQFTTMRQGGAPHSSAVIWLGWIFGLIAQLLVFSLYSLGASRQNKLRGLGKPFILIFTLTASVWTSIVVTYQDYIGNPDPALLFGFPLPTGLMIFVMPLAMLLISVLFVLRFPKSILTEEDLEKYQQLLDDKEQDS